MKILVIIALVLLGIVFLIFMLIKVVPIVLRFLLYNIISIPIWIMLLLTPGHLGEGALLAYLLYRAVVVSLNLDCPLIADFFTKQRKPSHVGGSNSDYSGGGSGHRSGSSGHRGGSSGHRGGSGLSYSGGSSSGHSWSRYYDPDYVLNRKTGVIHDAHDSSAETISERHRRNLSYYEASELVSRGGRYRFKKDSD